MAQPRLHAGPRLEPSIPRENPGKHTWFEVVETELLGLRALPFTRRAASVGWVPDDAAAYCWRCGGSVGPGEADGSGCASCRTHRTPWDGWLRLGAYEGVLRAGIQELKYARLRGSGRAIGRLMGIELADRLDRLGVERSRAAIVPMPMSLRHRLARGVDHALVLARAAATTSGCPVRRYLRRAHRPPQTGLSASARRRNLRGAFRSYNRSLNGYEIVVLVDDVRTTGVTMATACRALRGGRAWPADDGPRIWAFSAAVTTEQTRRGVGVSGVEG